MSKNFFRLRFPDVIFIAVLFLALALGPRMLGIDSDLGRHLTLGDNILDQRLIPTGDLFSHTSTGRSRPPYEWLSQVAFALSHRLLGLEGVILLTSTLIGLVFALVHQHAFRRSQSPLIALAVALIAAAASSLHWLPRPHIVTFLLLTIWIDKLERLRNGEKIKVYVFASLMLFWANLHGGFIFGFLALAAYSAGWLWDKSRGRAKTQTGKSLLFIGIGSLAASVITPDLWRNWEAVLSNRSAFILSRTAETMPPNFADASIMPFSILLALAVIYSLINRRTISASHVFLLGGLGAMSVLMARNIPLFSIACAPFLAEWISTKANRSSAWKKLDARFAYFSISNQPFLLPLLFLLLAAIFFAHNHSKGNAIYRFNPQVFPVEATDWLEKNPLEGRMFNEFNWGGYLLYRLWPRHLVFVDSQSDFYGEPLMRDYEAILLAQRNWRALLDEYRIEWAIVSPRSPLARELAGDEAWIIRYEDAAAIILQRK